MNNRTGKILIVDDDDDVLLAARLFLKSHVASVTTETRPERIPGLLATETYDVILLDMNFTQDVTSGREGLHWLQQILRIDPDATVILITAYADIELAVEAVKAGAVDFITKPWQNEKLLATINAARELSRSRQEVAHLRSHQRELNRELDLPFQDFIGDSPAIRQVRKLIDKVAGTDANVLITGENGTGKELVAREIHRRSRRASDAFVKVDLGAVPHSLFESELFGHVRGAFTDAREDRPGRFELASGGTLFLDEIGNIPPAMQVKILDAIQSRKVRRLGAESAVDIDIRLIAATNQNLDELIEQGEFRPDLLYRINTVRIEVPPLRERPGDVRLLLDHFLKRYGQKYHREECRLTAETCERLEGYGWPGNVRELQHAVERAVIMCEGTYLGSEDFLLSAPVAEKTVVAEESNRLEDIEKAAIQRVLFECGGNVSRAARELGITRASLYRRMQKYDI